MATCVSQHSSRMATVSSLMLLAAVLMALLHSTTAFPHGYTCGTGHDHVHAQAQPEVVAQQYHTAEHVTDEAQRRRLAEIVSEPYRTGIGGSFLPLSVAAAAGLAGPIRIKFLWDVVEGGDYSGSKSGTSARQCTVAGITATSHTHRAALLAKLGSSCCSWHHSAYAHTSTLLWGVCVRMAPKQQAAPSQLVASSPQLRAWSFGSTGAARRTW